MRARLTALHKLAYGAGAAGWAIGDRLLVAFGLYFYAPPDGAGAGGLVEKLPLFVVLGVALPVWGMASMVSRIVDTFADPVCASMTDRSTHPFGRRRIFMLIGALPLAVGSVAIFFPPFAERSWGNAAWAAFWLTFYFCSFSLYVCPFLALLPDLAKTARERIDLSTIQAIAALVGAGIVMIGGNILLGALRDVDGEARYRIVAVVFGCVSLLLMLVPIMGIPEPKLVEQAHPSSLPVFEAVKATLRAPGMKLYLAGSIAMWFGFNTVASGVQYFVTTLMREEESYAAVVLTATFATAGVSFPLVNVLAKRLTKRVVMMIGGGALAVLMAMVPLIHDRITGLVILGLGGFPIAVLMTVPNAILADLATSEAKKTGENREAMFFGAQGFFQKVNLGISTVVLAGLLNFGKSIEHPLGVQLIGPVAAVVLLLTVFCFWRYEEPADA